MPFHGITFSSFLTTKRTLTFGYIKWTPYFESTGIFLDIYCVCSVCHEDGKKFHQNTE